VKDVGLVGLPFSGKSTLFTALTKAGGAGGRSNQAVVPVPDRRLQVLTELERSRKTVPAQVRFVDVPGATSAQGLAELRVTDALAIVLRAFGADADPAKEWADVTAELVLADLAVVDSALENARRRAKGRSGGGGPEVATLERAHASLSDERLLRDVGFAEDELDHLRSLAALTLKPWIPVANLEEGASIPAGVPEGTVPVYASIEAETAGMAEDDARELLAEFGVEEPGLDRVVAASYQALDLITFLTTGDDETRAWEVRSGATAPEAAGVIHTDLQRGFIRAEVVGYDDLVAAGGWDATKTRGLLRVEGKDYVVREGDVVHVRFNV
jgi:GTP-binding protein YchF